MPGRVVPVAHPEGEARAPEVLGVLHDLRSPLTVIAGACFALRRIAPTAEVLRLVERIEGEASRIAERADEAGRLAGVATPAPANRQGHDLGAVVAEVVERFRVAARRTGVDVALTVGTALPVHAVAVEVERIVENVVGNAVRHAGRGGRVAVDVGSWRGEAVVRVSDDGTGGAGAAGDGWGVGLDAARRLAAAHGGDVVREPAALGAVFRIRIPLAPPAGRGPGGRAA